MLSLFSKSVKPLRWTVSASTRLFSTFRAKSLANEPLAERKLSRSWKYTRQRMADDPEYRQRILNEQNVWRINKYRDNAEWRRTNITRAVAYCTARRKQDAEWSAIWTARHRAYEADPEKRRRKRLHGWLSMNAWVLNEVAWRTHEPVRYEEKTEHRCQSCGIPRRLKLWWRRKSEVGFDCHGCFTADWQRAVPIGYEDHDFSKGFPKRR